MDERTLLRRWVHSHEEDGASEKVFRPSTYDFPPSRGRSFFECRGDGTAVIGGPGPTDRRTSREAHWTLDGDRLVLYESSPSSPFSVIQILSVDDERLVMKR